MILLPCDPPERNRIMKPPHHSQLNNNHSAAGLARWTPWLFLICLLSASALAATPDKPAGAPITLRNFKLTGDLSDGHATFTLATIVHVDSSKGGTLELLTGPVALTELGPHPKWRVRTEQNRYVLVFDRGGDFPVQLKFTAAVRESDGWNVVDFRVAPGPLQRIVLQ